MSAFGIRVLKVENKCGCFKVYFQFHCFTVGKKANLQTNRNTQIPFISHCADKWQSALSLDSARPYLMFANMVGCII